MSTEHELKCWPEFYDEVASGRKTFEIRQNDRGFEVGDVLLLNEFKPDTGYTGRSVRRLVTYATDWFQRPGWLVMAIQPVGETAETPDTKECTSCERLSEALRSVTHQNKELEERLARMDSLESHSAQQATASESETKGTPVAACREGQ